jgi:predicted PurR-regulated permease PerM
LKSEGALHRRSPAGLASSRVREDKAFRLLVIGVSLAFAWILWPLYGAVLWATVAAIQFAPLHRWLSRLMRERRSLAALTTVLIIVMIVIVPLALVAASLLQEATSVYDRIQSGELSIGRYFARLRDALPAWVLNVLDRFGLANLAGLQEQLGAGLMRGSHVLAGQAINIGQNTLDFVVSLFVMLYLLFFLLRDGDQLARRIKDAIPLRAEQQHALLDKLAIVVRATVKGNLVVAILQGALGGLIFWFLGIHAPLLWGVVMAVLSLLPVVGTGMVWVPVAIYLLATGLVWQGLLLIGYGVLVIGLVDNVVRPLLVGKDTKMPDYVVLISTLGGLAIFGFNGFLIGPLIAAMFIAVWEIFAASRASRAAEGS